MKRQIFRVTMATVIFCVAMLGLLTASNWVEKTLSGRWYEPLVGGVIFMLGFWALGRLNSVTSK